MAYFKKLSQGIEGSIALLLTHGEEVDPGHWQGYDTTGHSELKTDEIMNLTLSAHIPQTQEELVEECNPSMPWAEIEFMERVGGVPHNPHESLERWPWWQGQSATTMQGGEFSHTYSERFWPRHRRVASSLGADHDFLTPRRGIRYRYGDLEDVLALLRKHPLTRQATFPIFFPEDTGAVHGGRIPCTLHYHFLLRAGKLHLWYPIRSCDAVRHFRDDLYMAARLCQWVIEELSWDGENGVVPGMLHFTAYSFHVHHGDKHHLEAR
jgi:hypothetical protein